MGKRKCGNKEKCFENGEKYWGHLGGVLCLHAGEIYSGDESVNVCLKTGKAVELYTK